MADGTNEVISQTELEPSFKCLVEGVADVIWSTETDGTISYLSPQFKTTFGFETQDWIGRSPLELVHPDDINDLKDSIAFQAGEQKRVSIEFRHLCDDGSYLWVAVNSIPVFDDEGNITCHQGTTRDISKIKSAEFKLKDAQAQLQSMTENVPGVISRVVLHPDGSQTLTYISARVRELFEFDPHALLENMSEVWKRIHPDDVAEVERKMLRSAETLEPNHVAYRLVLEKKGTRWVEAWSLPSRMENGDVVFDGVVIDVTDLGRLDSLEREINFKQIFDNAPDAVFLIVADGENQGTIAAANKAAEQMHGYDAGELKGRNIAELDAPDAAQAAPGRLSRLANGEVLRFEINHLHRDGFEFPVEVTASRILVDGRPYVLAFDRNVTERKKAEAERRDLQNQLLKTQKLKTELELSNAQSQLRRMTENIPGVVYQYVVEADGSHSVKYISSKCRQMFGVEPEEALEDAEAIWKLIHADDVVSMRAKFANSEKTPERFVHEFRIAVPKLGIRWCSLMAQSDRQPNGDVIWAGVIFDITDRREVELANDVLEKATKTKDQFLANMSHELRTPLSAILGMTEGLKQGLYGETSELQLKKLDVVEESGLHLLKLINEILDLAKIETGKTSLDLTDIDVDQLCKSCLDLVSPQAIRKQITLSLNASWNLPMLQVDETRLRQILLNLLGNALKFTPEKGKVELKVEHLPGEPSSLQSGLFQFTVIDNGIGIDADRIDSLFQPFTQIDSSLSRKYPGSGLGLSLVKRFVELHSGTVSVDSEPGKGSRFTVELPNFKPTSRTVIKGSGSSLEEVSEAKEADQNDESQSLPLVLLAEDNDQVAMAFIPILEASGFRVSRASDGKSAVDFTLQQSPDLILMDIQMPVLDGLEAIRQIRSHSKFTYTPIIALSGFAMPNDSTRCLEAGADTFVSKPCNMPEIISKIRELIASRGRV